MSKFIYNGLKVSLMARPYYDGGQEGDDLMERELYQSIFFDDLDHWLCINEITHSFSTDKLYAQLNGDTRTSIEVTYILNIIFEKEKDVMLFKLAYDVD